MRLEYIKWHQEPSSMTAHIDELSTKDGAAYIMRAPIRARAHPSVTSAVKVASSVPSSRASSTAFICFLVVYFFSYTARTAPNKLLTSPLVVRQQCKRS
jgi:hypothetical protein